MAYSEVEEIQADFKDMEFTSETNVTPDDVSQFIDEADALIDAYVGTRYVVPVVSTSPSFKLLKLLSRSLVTARIKKIMEVKQEKGTDANQSVVGVLLSPAQVMKILADIRDDNLNMQGATQLVASLGFYSFNSANGVESKIKKDEKQW